MKKATPSERSSLKPQANNNSIKAQRSRLLQALQKSGPMGRTTIELREEHDIMSPASRVFELKEDGHSIEMVWTISQNAQGRNHRCGRYVLLMPKNPGNDSVVTLEE